MDPSAPSCVNPDPVPTLPLPTDPSTLSPAIASFLYYLHDIPTSPYIHPRLISWTKATDKANWAPYLLEEDLHGRDHFSNWATAVKGAKNCSFALFSMWTCSHIRQPDWQDTPWHIWGAAILKSGSANHLFIWDCDPRDPYTQSISPPSLKRPHQFLLPVQIKLLRYLRWERKIKFAGLFYHIGRLYADQDRCLEYTCQWIQRMAEYRDIPFQGLDSHGLSIDPRTVDCVYLTKW